MNGADDQLRDLVAKWRAPGTLQSHEYRLVAILYAFATHPRDNFLLRKLLHLEGLTPDDVHPLIAAALAQNIGLTDIRDPRIERTKTLASKVADVIEMTRSTPDSVVDQLADIISVPNKPNLIAELDAKPIGAVDEGDDELVPIPAAASAVELMSLVGAKGLSADHVMIIGADDVNMKNVTPRTFYVGMTRARRSLHIVTAAQSGGGKFCHSYVDDVPPERCEYVIHTKGNGEQAVANKQA
jgi:ATP-dependent exoDNAse (exonuclease V) beta subunit